MILEVAPHGRLACAIFIAGFLSLTAGTTGAIAQDELPPTDLRYTGLAIESPGCFPAGDPKFVNPLNLEENILGFSGTPDNPRPHVKYAVELPDSVSEGDTLRAYIQVRFVQGDGWEPAEALATVKHEDRGAPLAESSYVASQAHSTHWSFEFIAKGPGVYTITVRMGGARYFHGQLSSTIATIPTDVTSETRADWFAAYELDEALAVAFEARGVSAPGGQEVRDTAFPQTVIGDPTINAVSWSYNSFAPRRNAIYYPVSVQPEDTERELMLGVFLRYPVGEGRLQVRDATEDDIVYLDMPIYPSPEVRVIWAPVRFDEPGVYNVLFVDEGSGRAEASVYRLCYLKAAPQDPVE